MKQNKNSGKKGIFKHMHLSWTELIAGIAVILIGLVLLISPGIATSLLFGVIGAVCIIIGLVYVVRYFMLEAKISITSFDLSLGLVWILGGVLVIVFKGLLISLLPILFGLIILIGGVVKIQSTLSFRRMNATRWYIELVCAIISIAFGVIILLNPFSTALLLMRVIGAGLVVEGVMDLASRIFFKRACDAYFIETDFTN